MSTVDLRCGACPLSVCRRLCCAHVWMRSQTAWPVPLVLLKPPAPQTGPASSWRHSSVKVGSALSGCEWCSPAHEATWNTSRVISRPSRLPDVAYVSWQLTSFRTFLVYVRQQLLRDVQVLVLFFCSCDVPRWCGGGHLSAAGARGPRWRWCPLAWAKPPSVLHHRLRLRSRGWDVLPWLFEGRCDVCAKLLHLTMLVRQINF